jgi:hypothetical protein
MGWNLRKGFNFGPLRINLSRRGVGYSVGARGLRIGRDAITTSITMSHGLSLLCIPCATASADRIVIVHAWTS